jgi:hypothetical protein
MKDGITHLAYEAGHTEERRGDRGNYASGGPGGYHTDSREHLPKRPGIQLSLI